MCSSFKIPTQLLLLQVMVEKLTPERLSHEFSLGPDAPQTAVKPSPTHKTAAAAAAAAGDG
jgi:hypothetical protein